MLSVQYSMWRVDGHDLSAAAAFSRAYRLCVLRGFALNYPYE